MKREIYSRIAELKTRLNRDDEAIKYALKALEKSPKDPTAHERLTERYLDMQQYDKAIAAYEKAIALDQRNFAAHFALARLYRNKHQLSKALGFAIWRPVQIFMLEIPYVSQNESYLDDLTCRQFGFSRIQLLI